MNCATQANASESVSSVATEYCSRFACVLCSVFATHVFPFHDVAEERQPFGNLRLECLFLLLDRLFLQPIAGIDFQNEIANRFAAVLSCDAVCDCGLRVRLLRACVCAIANLPPPL